MSYIINNFVINTDVKLDSCHTGDFTVTFSKDGVSLVEYTIRPRRILWDLLALSRLSFNSMAITHCYFGEKLFQGQC